MDPVSSAAQAFQQEFRAFRDNPEARVLLVEAEIGALSAVQATLRGEEWQPENRSPFLLFSHAHDLDGDCFVAKADQLRAHYDELRKGLAKEGHVLAPFEPQATQARTRFDYLLQHLVQWVELTSPVLEPPLYCWLVPQFADAEAFQATLRALLTRTAQLKIRFVFSEDPAQRQATPVLAELSVPTALSRFALDEGAMKQWFKTSMLATPRRGRAPGAMAGAAAPDVEPPPRPGPPRPTDEQIQKALQEAGLPPVLGAAQGEELQRLVFTAAEAVSAGDADRALGQQYEAYQLCGRAGVVLEQGLMALVLAGYFVQFRREAEACSWFQEAARLASTVSAFPQVSQALMGLAGVHFMAGRHEEAARAYRSAAAAATEGETPLLAIENLRMAGVCLRHLRRDEEAITVLFAAADVGKAASPGEIAASSLPAVMADLKAMLAARQQRSEQDRFRAVEHDIALKLQA